MNLIKGKLVTSLEERDAMLDILEEEIHKTLLCNELSLEAVLHACDTFSKLIGKEHYDLLVKAGVPASKAQLYLSEAKSHLAKSNLKRRMEIELANRTWTNETQSSTVIKEKILPLGTLLHIVAGNQFGLALYSTIEGLLTGNINLIKLPSDDNGLLSIMIFMELMKIEPLLSNYIYLFDYTSRDGTAMKKLMKLADAVVVWGGDESIQSIRKMAEPNTKLIEWGHKLSFAYITPNSYDPKLLHDLAQHIAETNQLLCSSCQGIFIDTDSMKEVYEFCEIFLPILNECYVDCIEELPMEIKAKTGLMVYTAGLQDHSCQIMQKEKASLLVYENACLEPAIPYGNPWVKKLPRKELISTLRPYKSHLQTVALLCQELEKEELTELLWKAGVTRVTQGKNMSRVAYGGAHDGEYPLRRYIRVVSQEFIDD